MPDPNTEQKLRDAIHAGDTSALLALTAGMPEAERRKHAPAMIEELELFRTEFRTFSSRGSKFPESRLEAARTAVLATATFLQIRKLEWSSVPDVESVISVMRDRRPEWADDFGAWRCRWWRYVRPLVTAGVCRRPAGDEYLHAWLTAFVIGPQGSKSRTEWLLGDPELLDEEVWRLFEIEGTSEANLAAVDKYTHSTNSWASSFIELSRQGKLDRQRLLDASLEALARDFIQFRAGWFSRFHEALEPTLAERAQRLDAYLGLLGSSIPPTGVMALEALLVIDKTQPLASAKVFPHLHFLVLAKAKGTAKKALQWVAAIHKREPACLSTASALMRSGLRHEATEVQAFALAFLEKQKGKASAEGMEELSALLDSISSTLKPRLRALIGGEAPAPVKAAPIAPVASAIVIDPLDPARAIPGIADINDLLDQAARALEAPLDFSLMERVFHGMAGLPLVRDDSFRKVSAALAKRIAKILKAGHHDSHLASCRAITAWLDGSPGTPYKSRTRKKESTWCEEAMWEYRANFAATVAAGEVRLPLPATPTHQGGWIDPRVLVSRCQAWQAAGTSPPSEEMTLAILRLAQGTRAQALLEATDLKGEWADALRFALGADSIPIGPTASLWIAAARSREPFASFPALEERHPGRGPDAAFPAIYHWNVTKESSGPYGQDKTIYWHHYLRIAVEPKADPKRVNDAPLLQFHVRERHFSTSHLVSWAATFWPANLEAWLSEGAILIFGLYEVDHHVKAYLEALLDPVVPLRPIALLVLATGLGCMAAEIRMLATDLLIGALESQRFQPSDLGAVLSRLLVESGVPLQRWQKCLAEAARVSPLHLSGVIAILESALQGDPDTAPRDLGKLLGLLVELQAAAGTRLDNPDTRNYLAGIKTSGATAKMVKQLLT